MIFFVLFCSFSFLLVREGEKAELELICGTAAVQVQWYIILVQYQQGTLFDFIIIRERQEMKLLNCAGLFELIMSVI
jgi:hypothetical protein